MKKVVIFCFLVLVIFSANAQKINPVKWTFETVKKGDKSFDIICTATIESPWHIYSQFTNKGPVATTIKFKPNPLVLVKGAAKEIGKLEKHYDKNFDAEIAYFSNKVQFVQTITLKVASKTKVAGTIEYVVCNDERCLPPTTIPFEVAVQ